MPRPQARKHIILFVPVGPQGGDGADARVIQLELERGKYGGRFLFDPRWAAQPHDLLGALRKIQPTIVHFCGCGGQSSEDAIAISACDGGAEITVLTRAPAKGLFLRATDGGARFVSSVALQEVFGVAGKSVRVVVFDASYSEELAEALTAQVDCAVGMGGAIDGNGARDFASQFYGALADGETVASAYLYGRAGILVNRDGRPDASRPELKVRGGVDADELNLTAVRRGGSEPRAALERVGPARLAMLSETLRGAFADRIDALREIASLYVELSPWLQVAPVSSKEFVEALVRASYRKHPQVLQSVLRSARRRNRGDAALTRAIVETWRFADGLDFPAIDELQALLRSARVGLGQLRDATRRALGAGVEPPLWEPRGGEPIDDLIEGLAQFPRHLQKVVVLLRDVQHVAEVAAWIRRVAPDTPEPARSPAAPSPQRLLLVLHRGANDHYAVEVYLSEPGSKWKRVTSLKDPVPLTQVPKAFAATLEADRGLQTVLAGRVPWVIEIMLPVRHLLTRVDRWDLFGTGPIGERFPVVVRPFERAFAGQHWEYLGGSMVLAGAREALQRAPAMRQVELGIEQVKTAVERGHPQHWCVAAFHCPEPVRAESLAALDELVRQGVVAMLAVHDRNRWPDHLRADDQLPSKVRLHRSEHPEHPVTLLWDEIDFNPESVT